ncbi:MAG: LrgB family protein [Bacteroidales bacterium]|nr:LrgB family protein [Bacteroidales bacterium]MDE6238004.1 LrgB family protein [Muribaculaceae bacterium]MDE6835440.1 LrgB family protein [Muribaculaceae bacterium]MDE6866243.1 LrgB family protein [Muribaculaceae bacterium]
MNIIEHLSSPMALITITFLVYWGSGWLQKKSGQTWMSPMLLTIAFLIAFLKITGISFEKYYESGSLIEFWLKPAIVALGLPLFNELKHIRSQFLTLFITEVVGCLVGIITVVLVAKWLGAAPDVIASLAPKSVSTPIAIEISRQIGGIPALTSAIVVVVGMIGSALGLKMMAWGHVNHAVSQSLSMGTAAHVMGTNRISIISDRYGAYATLGLILNGILTAFFAGPLMEMLM